VSISRILTLLGRDLRRGPRSAVFLYATGMPILIVVVTKVILLTLFDPEPRLGLVDLGQSEIGAMVEQLEGVELTTARSEQELRQLVVDHDVDAGVVLDDGFDEAVRAGERPRLGFYVSGESRVTHRLVLGLTAVDLVRRVEGRTPPAEVRTATVGERTALPIEDLVLLGILLWPLLVCSTLVPATMLVQDKEHRTLHAVLATPTTLSEVLLAKGLLGFGLAMVMCLITLALAGSLTAAPVPLLVALAVSVVICTELGLLYGTTAKDAKSVYNMAQTFNVIILAPLIFYFFPSWPQWIAKLFPTWWFIDPLYRISMQGASVTEVAPDLGVALVVAAALVVPVVLLGRRMRSRLVAG